MKTLTIRNGSAIGTVNGGYYEIKGRACGIGCFYADRYESSEYDPDEYVLTRENVNLTRYDILDMVRHNSGKSYDWLEYEDDEKEEAQL